MGFTRPRPGYRAIVAVPLLVGGEPVGTLNCPRRSVHEFGVDELALLSTLANQAGTALWSWRLITLVTEQRRLLEQAEEIHRGLNAGLRTQVGCRVSQRRWPAFYAGRCSSPKTMD